MANSANIKKFVKSLQVICHLVSTKVLNPSLCLISDILERINRFQVSFLKKIPNFFSAHANKVFFLVYFCSRQHLATPTHPPRHQTWSFGHPTHPPLWWRNTWMVPYLIFKMQIWAIGENFRFIPPSTFFRFYLDISLSE